MHVILAKISVVLVVVDVFDAGVERGEDKREGGRMFFVEDRVSEEWGGEENVDGFKVQDAIGGGLGEGS